MSNSDYSSADEIDVQDDESLSEEDETKYSSLLEPPEALYSFPLLHEAKHEPVCIDGKALRRMCFPVSTKCEQSELSSPIDSLRLRDYLSTKTETKVTQKLIYDSEMKETIDASAVKECPFNFDADFESGNVGSIYQVFRTTDPSTNLPDGVVYPPAAFEFNVYVRKDLNTEGNMQWFYFCLQTKDLPSVVYPCVIRFHLVNMRKKDSLHNYGMKIAMFSKREESRGWHHGGENISYYCNHTPIESKAKRRRGPLFPVDNRPPRVYYTLTFSHRLEAPDTVFFAYSVPYTYTDLQEYLVRLEFQNEIVKRVMRKQLLCKTLAGNACELLTICEPVQAPEEALRQARPVIVVAARIHPGETIASYAMEGFIQFLCGNSPEALTLRKLFVFKIIPMMNPDGVIHGNNRCNLIGTDLNRRYADTHPIFHPTVHALKLLLASLQESRGVYLFLDLHGHSRKKNAFVYGCDLTMQSQKFADIIAALPVDFVASKRLYTRIYPRILCAHGGEEDQENPFSWRDSSFVVQRSKSGTGRVVAWRKIGVECAYTVELSFCSRGDNSERKLLQEAFSPGKSSVESAGSEEEKQEQHRRLVDALVSTWYTNPESRAYHFTTDHYRAMGERMVRAIAAMVNVSHNPFFPARHTVDVKPGAVVTGLPISPVPRETAVTWNPDSAVTLRSGHRVFSDATKVLEDSVATAAGAVKAIGTPPPAESAPTRPPPSASRNTARKGKSRKGASGQSAKPLVFNCLSPIQIVGGVSVERSLPTAAVFSAEAYRFACIGLLTKFKHLLSSDADMFGYDIATLLEANGSNDKVKFPAHVWPALLARLPLRMQVEWRLRQLLHSSYEGELVVDASASCASPTNSVSSQSALGLPGLSDEEDMGGSEDGSDSDPSVDNDDLQDALSNAKLLFANKTMHSAISSFKAKRSRRKGKKQTRTPSPRAHSATRRSDTNSESSVSIDTSPRTSGKVPGSSAAGIANLSNGSQRSSERRSSKMSSLSQRFVAPTAKETESADKPPMFLHVKNLQLDALDSIIETKKPKPKVISTVYAPQVQSKSPPPSEGIASSIATLDATLQALLTDRRTEPRPGTRSVGMGSPGLSERTFVTKDPTGTPQKIRSSSVSARSDW